MRLLSTIAASLLFVGCHPSATLQRTTPVANLQTFTTTLVRVRSTAFAAQGAVVNLQNQVIAVLAKKCAFQQAADGATADVILDLTINQTGRGSSGIITNENVQTVSALLVLTDGADGGLLGTASIHGESSGSFMGGGDPIQEATGAIANSVGDLLVQSGCNGPRVAKAAPEPPPVVATAPDESKRPEAEKLSDAGKEKLYNSDLPGALALFQQANALLPDAKYEFNGCLVLGALERWDEAIASCKKARTMNASPALIEKIDKRLAGFAEHH